MTALTKGRTVESLAGTLFAYPVLANAVIHQGAIVVIAAAGYAKPGVTGTALTTVGIARHPVDATGLANGAVTVEVEEMVAACTNLGADAVTVADIGKVCFLVDDQTVAKTDGTGTRSPAGIVRKIDGSVFVKLSNTIATIAGLL